MIAWTFLSAFAGAGLLLLLPVRQVLAARVIALVTALVGLAVAAWALCSYDRSAGAEIFQFAVRLDWIPAAGISFHLAADGISLVLLVLTGIVAVTGVLFSWNIERAPQRFFALFFLIIGGAYGVFLSLDLFLLLVFYEIVILPKYLLIVGWGSTNKAYAGMKLTLYSIFGSALVIIGIIAAFVAAGGQSFDLLDLAKADFAPAFQVWVFPVLFLGFAILAGIWPFHTWAPGGHVAAPTAASMLLAGVVMKLGAYGALRVAMPLFPDGLEQWRMVFALCAAIGILWGAGVALAQRDLKFVIGYSSISHMGFVLLGLLALGPLGVAGGVLQMFSHGVIAALLFAVVGRMVYDRTHTRDLAELAKLNLARALPFTAVVFVVISAASMGLPGFSGFIAELMVLLGTWGSFPWLLIPAGLGVVLTAAFTLKALQKSFFPRMEGPRSSLPVYPASTWPERIGAGVLILVAVAVGLFPQMLLDLILSSFHSDLMRVLFP